MPIVQPYFALRITQQATRQPLEDVREQVVEALKAEQAES